MIDTMKKCSRCGYHMTLLLSGFSCDACSGYYPLPKKKSKKDVAETLELEDTLVKDLSKLFVRSCK